MPLLKWSGFNNNQYSSNWCAPLHDFSRFCQQTSIFLAFHSYTGFPDPYVCVCVSLVRWLCSIKHRADSSAALLSSLRHCASLSLSLLPSNNKSSLLHCSDSRVKLMRTDSSACVSLTFLISAPLSCSTLAISLWEATISSTRMLSVNVSMCVNCFQLVLCFQYCSPEERCALTQKPVQQSAAQLKEFLLRSSDSIAMAIFSPVEVETLLWNAGLVAWEDLIRQAVPWDRNHTHSHTHTHVHAHDFHVLWGLSIDKMLFYCSNPLTLNLPIPENFQHFYIFKKHRSVWFIRFFLYIFF